MFPSGAEAFSLEAPYSLEGSLKDESTKRLELRIARAPAPDTSLQSRVLTICQHPEEPNSPRDLINMRSPCSGATYPSSFSAIRRPVLPSSVANIPRQVRWNAQDKLKCFQRDRMVRGPTS